MKALAYHQQYTLIITATTVYCIIMTHKNVSYKKLEQKDLYLSLCLSPVSPSISAAGFDWSLHFKWEQLSAEKQAKRADPTEPIK